MTTRLLMAFAIVFLPPAALIRAARKAWLRLDPETQKAIREIVK